MIRSALASIVRALPLALLAGALSPRPGFAEDAPLRGVPSDVRLNAGDAPRHIPLSMQVGQSDEAIARPRRQVEARCRILEIDRRRMLGKEGLTLVRNALGDRFEERPRPLAPQVMKALLVKSFRETAEKQKIVTTLGEGTVTVPFRRTARFELRADEADDGAPLPNPADAAPRKGVSLVFATRRLTTDRIELEIVADVRQPVWPRPTPDEGAAPATDDSSIGSRTLSTSCDVASGETIVISGFVSTGRIFDAAPRSSKPAGKPSSEGPADDLPGSEVILLVTPVLPAGRAGLDAANSGP